MGKNLIQQKRGKGSPTYRAPSFRYQGMVDYPVVSKETVEGEVLDLVHCPGHNSPLAKIRYSDGKDMLMNAPEGIKVGDTVKIGNLEEVNKGDITSLRNIPEGTVVFNVEKRPGDGGKFIRSSGGFARLVSKTDKKVILKMPSNKQKEFNPDCRATIGMIAGSGRKEKPFLKAGNKHYAMKSKNKLWPKVCGVSMNSIDHPFGGSSSHSKGRPTQASRHAPPGRKVGKIAPKRTGKKK